MKRFLVSALLITHLSFAQDTVANSADHESLRALLTKATEAINKRDFETLQSVFETKFTFTTVDQKVFYDFTELKKYFEDLTQGQNAPLKNLIFKPTASKLTDIVGDMGLSTGTSNDTYEFSDGDVRDMKSNWTAVLHRANGDWKVTSLHMGVNPMDNPVLAVAKNSIVKIALLAAVVGGFLGFLIGFVVKKKKFKG